MPPIEAKALGVLEVVGLSFAVAAADAMVKTAPVQIASESRAGGGLVSIAVTGDIASVRAAVEAGAREVASLGGSATTSVLGRPDPEVIGALSASTRPAELHVSGTSDDVSTGPPRSRSGSGAPGQRTARQPDERPASKRSRRGSAPS